MCSSYPVHCSCVYINLLYVDPSSYYDAFPHPNNSSIFMAHFRKHGLASSIASSYKGELTRTHCPKFLKKSMAHLHISSISIILTSFAQQG